MFFFSLYYKDGLMAIFGCKEELDESEMSDIESIALVACEESDEDIDETIELIIENCKKELALDIFHCSPCFDIFLE